MDLRIKLSPKHVCSVNIFKGKGYVHIFNNHKKSSISLNNDEFQKLHRKSQKIIKHLNTESCIDKKKTEKKRKQEPNDDDDDDDYDDNDDEYDDTNMIHDRAEMKKKANKKNHRKNKTRFLDENQDTESD